MSFNLIKDLQQAMTDLANAASKATTAAETISAAATAVTSVASPSPAPSEPVPQSLVESQPSQPTGTLGKVESVINTVETVANEAAPVLDLIPGVGNIVAVMTTVLQLVNHVEAVVNDLKNHSPNTWAQIESTFGEAVKDWENHPKL